MSARLLIIASFAAWVSAFAQGPLERKPATYRSAEIEQSTFTHNKVGMLELECEKIAQSLASIVMVRFNDRRSSWTKEEAALAGRIVALARHLNPKNRLATEIDASFAAGERVEVPWEKPKLVVLVETLVQRAKFLQQTGKELDIVLAGCFVEVAADLDPKNENAIFAYEVFRRDVGFVKWEVVSGRAFGEMFKKSVNKRSKTRE